MKNILTFLLFFISANLIYSQSYKTEEITKNYTDGTEVFNILLDKNPAIIYNPDLEYFWYTDFTHIQTSKGDSGGQLLHGTYVQYNTAGALIHKRNYKMGLKDGISTFWDNQGNITDRLKYDKGTCVFTKFKNDQGEWISWENESGELFQTAGATKKYYNEINRLTAKEFYINTYGCVTTLYHEDALVPQTKSEEYNNWCFGDYSLAGGLRARFGEFKEWDNAGTLIREGKYYTPEVISPSTFHLIVSEIRDGDWIWYEDGERTTIETYRPEFNYWDSGNIKSVGSYLLREDGTEEKYDFWTSFVDGKTWERTRSFHLNGEEFILEEK